MTKQISPADDNRPTLVSEDRKQQLGDQLKELVANADRASRKARKTVSVVADKPKY